MVLLISFLVDQPHCIQGYLERQIASALVVREAEEAATSVAIKRPRLGWGYLMNRNLIRIFIQTVRFWGNISYLIHNDIFGKNLK